MRKLMAIAGMMTGMLLVQVAPAAEITVLSGGAVEPGLNAAAAAFEKAAGHMVKITYTLFVAAGIE